MHALHAPREAGEMHPHAPMTRPREAVARSGAMTRRDTHPPTMGGGTQPMQARNHTHGDTHGIQSARDDYPPEGIDPMLSAPHADGAPHREDRHRTSEAPERTPAERATMDPTTPTVEGER